MWKQTKKINNKLSQIRHVNVGGKTVNFDVFKSHEGTRKRGGEAVRLGKQCTDHM